MIHGDGSGAVLREGEVMGEGRRRGEGGGGKEGSRRMVGGRWGGGSKLVLPSQGGNTGMRDGKKYWSRMLRDPPHNPARTPARTMPEVALRLLGFPLSSSSL